MQLEVIKMQRHFLRPFQKGPAACYHLQGLLFRVLLFIQMCLIYQQLKLVNISWTPCIYLRKQRWEQRWGLRNLPVQSQRPDDQMIVRHTIQKIVASLCSPFDC